MDNKQNSFTKTFSIDLEREKYRKKVNRGRKIRFLIVLFFWLAAVSFSFTPYSRASTFALEGNFVLQDEQIITKTKVENRQMFLLDTEIIKNTLIANEAIIDAKVEKRFGSLNIWIKELTPLGIYNDQLLLNDGRVVGFDEYALKDEIDLTQLPILDMDSSYLENFYTNFSNVPFSSIKMMEHIEVTKIGENYIANVLFESEEIGFFIIRSDLSYSKFQLSSDKLNRIKRDILEIFGEEKHSKTSPVLVEYISIDFRKYTIVE